MKYNLSSLCEYRKGKVSIEKLDTDTYISTENMLPNKGGIVQATSLPTTPQTQEYKKGDVLVSNIRPYFKKIWKARFDGGCSNDVLVFKANDDTDEDFLYYVLSNDTFFNYSMATSKGTKMPRGDKTSIMQYEVPDFDIVVQRKIASILSLLDKKIELNNKINNNLEAQAIALYKAWFVDFQPYEGQKPSSWVQMSLEKITSLVSRGITPKYSDDSDQIILNQKCIRNHAIDLAPSRSHMPKAITEKWLQFGDLLINSTGTGTLGRAAQVLFVPNNLTVDSHVTIVRPADPLYVYFIGLWGITHETEIEALHTGSTGQTELPRDRVKSMEILVPDAESLIKFNKLIGPLSKLMVNNQDENIRLAEVRDALLPRLLSGELDVSELDL